MTEPKTYGECRVALHRDAYGRETLTLMRADRSTRVFAELVEHPGRYGLAGCAVVETHYALPSLVDDDRAHPQLPPITTLTVTATNGRVMYRIDRSDYDPDTRTYRADWID